MLNATRTGASPFGGTQTRRVGVKEEVDVAHGGPGFRTSLPGL